jgi:sugar phosphate isomerase/epimerase
MIGASSFAAQLPELDEYVDSVELYIPKLDVYNGKTLDRERLSSILDDLSTCDLETSIHAPYFADVPTYPSDLVVDTAAMDKQDFRLMEESIDLAAEIGSHAVVIHPGIYGADYEKSFNKMIANLKELAAFASDRGVVLGLENKENTAPDNLCCGAEEVVRAVLEVDSPSLGITFDVGHANLTCRGDCGLLRHFARLFAEHVVHVHVHDNHGECTSDYFGDAHLGPGSGCIDYTVLEELSGFGGIFNLEVYSLDDVIAGRNKLDEMFP